eukprot:TRINITY_DN5635_c0_g1_i2.p1 TRINITY_DN5635_c0_g1~~TRINITY_DN5635_c0_g1_i2.p1  ORF type:complete len:156 (-),score=17.76 TRINITY_DN5635_c0_g1_i2:35-502(-)
MAVESFDAAPAASVNSFAPCLPGWSAFESRKGFIERLRKAVCILSSGLEQHASADLSHLSHLRLLSVLLAALGAHSTIVAARPSKTHPIPHHFLQASISVKMSSQNITDSNYLSWRSSQVTLHPSDCQDVCSCVHDLSMKFGFNRSFIYWSAFVY